MLGGVALMGEIHFGEVGSGFMTTIHDDGTTSTAPTARCDGCGLEQTQSGGLAIRDVGQETVLWLCYKCRA